MDEKATKYSEAFRTVYTSFERFLQTGRVRLVLNDQLPWNFRALGCFHRLSRGALVEN